MGGREGGRERNSQFFFSFLLLRSHTHTLTHPNMETHTYTHFPQCNALGFLLCDNQHAVFFLFPPVMRSRAIPEHPGRRQLGKILWERQQLCGLSTPSLHLPSFLLLSVALMLLASCCFFVLQVFFLNELAALHHAWRRYYIVFSRSRVNRHFFSIWLRVNMFVFFSSVFKNVRFQKNLFPCERPLDVGSIRFLCSSFKTTQLCQNLTFTRKWSKYHKMKQERNR